MLYVTAVHTFAAEHGDELEFEAGDRIEVLEKDDAFGDGWWRGRNAKGEEGLFPATYISESSSPIASGGGEGANTTTAQTQPSPDPSTASGGEPTLIPAVNRPPSPRASPRSSIAPDQVGPTDVSPAGGDTGVVATAAAGLGAAAVGVGAVLSKTVNEVGHALEGLAVDDNAPSSLSQRSAGTGTAGEAAIGGMNANENTDIRQTFGSDPRAHFASTHDQIQSFDSVFAGSEDEHNRTLNSESEQGHGIDSSARARLAAQAKLANEREQARANNRISTGVSGLVYSDESEGEDDDDEEIGGRRVSYKTQSLTLGGAGAGYGNGLGNGHPTGQPMDSIGSALQPALPLPGTPPLFTGTAGGSVPASSTHTPRSGSLHTASASASYPSAPAGAASHNSTAAQWTVDEVVEWAKSKGFDESIWSKFQEHEITGDLLLELDANLLKELDIPAFGKRLRIAQAIGELKRPYTQGQGQGHGQGSPSGSVSGRGTSQPPSSFVMPTHTGSGSGTGTGTGFGLGQGSFAGTGHRGSTPPAAVTPPLSGGPTDGYSAWAHPPVSAANHMGAGGGTHSSSHSRKTSSISGSISGSGAGGMTAIKESERATVISSSVPPSPSPHTPGSVGSGPTSGSTAVGTNGNGTGNGSQRNSSTGGATLTKRNSAGSGSGSGSMSMSKSASLGHKRGKSSVDGGSSTKERLSFFGRNRKPAPAAPDNISTSTSGGGAGLDRSGSTTGTGGGGFKGFGGNKVHQMQPASPNQRSPSSATMGSNANMAGVGGAGALKQIGTPDYSGWMKKKGDRYGWKNRYFVLKGAHLYFLKSEHEDKVKGHIPLAGYRVIVDENTNPGSYGFRLIPSSPSGTGGSTVNSPSSPNNNNASHAFSSSEQSVIRGWMKALMKATIARDYAVPVTSSCNIPTIPLAEAQALQPRPPSPTTRERTQRATRRENTSSLTPHDASVLTSLSGGPGSNRISLTPSRPERDVRRPSAQFSTRSTSIAPTEAASPQKQSIPLSSPPNLGLARPLSNQTGISGGTSSSNIDHTSLLAFVNSTLPSQYPRATSFPGSFISGEVIFLLVRSVSGIEPNPPVPPSAFAKDADGKPGVDGLFAMMDMLLDAGIDPAGVSLNEVREGNREAIGVLVGSVRTWCEKR